MKIVVTEEERQRFRDFCNNKDFPITPYEVGQKLYLEVEVTDGIDAKWIDTALFHPEYIEGFGNLGIKLNVIHYGKRSIVGEFSNKLQEYMNRIREE